MPSSRLRIVSFRIGPSRSAASSSGSKVRSSSAGGKNWRRAGAMRKI